MVPPEAVIRQLTEAYEALRSVELDVNRYGGAVFDAAFDLVTLETAVAGVADTAVETGRVDREVVPLLAAPSRLRGTRWALQDGREADLAGHPELVEQAGRIERVRALLRRLAGA